jgi:hypothetical protein
MEFLEELEIAVGVNGHAYRLAVDARVSCGSDWRSPGRRRAATSANVVPAPSTWMGDG